MLFLLRLIFGFALFAVFAKAVQVAGPYPMTEGPTDAGYVALAAVVGIANAVVWAPYIGRLMAEPLTGAFTAGHPGDSTNHVVQFIHKLALRRRRRLALFFAFLEGVRHPDLPAAFVLGLGNARPGSWLEKAFAREVWRFDNAENCLRAWRVLRAGGIDPGLHRAAEVNLLILSADREKRPEPSVLSVPPAPPPPPPIRNPRIRLFDGAVLQRVSASGEHGVAEPAAATATPSASRSAKDSDRPAGLPEAAGEGGALPGVVPGAGTGTTGPVAPPPAPLSWRERWRILRTGRIHD
jgi:hypothetical protein